MLKTVIHYVQLNNSNAAVYCATLELFYVLVRR